MFYDLIIIGAGPAGAAAAVYAGRKQFKTLLITESFGGQSSVASAIKNWIGVPELSGHELSAMLERHVKLQKGIKVLIPESAVRAREVRGGFEILTNKGKKCRARALIVSSGGRRRKLQIPGESKFEGRGVSYCPTCDAPLFRGKAVAVIGGGNAGLEAVVDLLPYARKIYLINSGPDITGDTQTYKIIKKSAKVSIIHNARILEVFGDKFVNGLRYLDLKANKAKAIRLEGIMVEIGSVPNSEFLRGLVAMNKSGEIITDHKTCRTSRPGIFAAGDATDGLYKQNNVAAGEGIKALLSAYNYLLGLHKTARPGF